ncbi:MAG: hypothetical protein ACE148_01325 [Vicinamibacterales bacterium]
MTYNFDPDKWFENQRALLERKREKGEIDQAKFAELLDELERRYDELVERVSRSFELPK